MTNNNKEQTAVDCIIEFCQKRMFMEASVHQVIYLSVIKFCEEHAKEMEKEQRSIELPSDEEISEESMDLYGKLSASITDVLQYKAFKRGAKWMRDKIQGGEQ